MPLSGLALRQVARFSSSSGESEVQYSVGVQVDCTATIQSCAPCVGVEVQVTL